MPRPFSFDPAAPPVLVVGGGPTGLAAAIGVARMGVPVRIVDASDAATTLSKALVVWRRSLLALDAAIPFERFLEAGHEVQGSRFFGDGRLGPVLEFERGHHELPPGVLIPQADTERLLESALKEVGVRVERSTRLVECTPEGDHVRATLEGPQGREVVKAGWLLGCDGAHSTVRHALGLEFPGEAVARRWVLADIEVVVEDGVNPRSPHCEEERTLEPGWMHLDSSDEGTAAIFPMAANRHRVIFDGGPVGSGESTPVTLEEVRSLLYSRTRLQWRITRAHWLSEFSVNERQVERYVHGRVALCGDAAHVHSPAGGQGMNTGLQDATNAAWKVALAARGHADERLVETYHEERHPVGAKVLAMSGRMLRASMLANPLLKQLRNFGMLMAFGIPAVRRRFAASLTEDDIDYSDGPLSGAGHEAGHALPDVAITLSDQTRPATDLLRRATGCLFLGAEARSESMPALSAIPHMAVRRLGDSEAALANALRLGPRDAALVRPDGIIAAVGGPEAIKEWCASAGVR